MNKRATVLADSPESLFAACAASGHPLICAGQALAIREAMVARDWSMHHLAAASGISRQMICAVLNLRRFPTTAVISQLSQALGMELFELDLLALLCIRSEPSL